MNETKIYRFTEKCVSLAKKVVDNPEETAIPEGGGKYVKWTIIALHCLKKYIGKSYRVFTDILKEMPRILNKLRLNRHTLPHYSTLCIWFDRLYINVWQTLLKLSSKNKGHTAIDSTGFERDQPSRYYANRSNYNIKSLKVTPLIDIKSKTIIDVHITTSKKHDTQIGKQVIKRNIDKLTSIAGDKGYDWQKIRDKLREHNVRPLIKHREFTQLNKAHNTRIKNKDYNKRWTVETAFSSIKRCIGSTVNSQK